MVIKNNFLFLRKETEFNNKVLNLFYNRLKLFLLIDYNAITPYIIFSSNQEELNDRYGDTTGKDQLAFYDEDTHTTVINAKKHLYHSDDYAYEYDVQLPSKKYKYVIPLTVVYHELIHHVQYCYSNYQYTDLIEGSADLFSYIITGQNNIDYLDECKAIHYLSKHILKLNYIEFYSFIAKIITNSNYPVKYLSTNKRFLYLLNKQYNNNMRVFLNNLRRNFSHLGDEADMHEDVKKLWSLIYGSIRV